MVDGDAWRQSQLRTMPRAVAQGQIHTSGREKEEMMQQQIFGTADRRLPLQVSR